MNRLRARVLLIDDSPSSLVWQLVLLQEENYDTLTANCTVEGVQIARTERPDLVILDATTRHKDVAAAASALRAEQVTSHIPILVVVGGRARATAEFSPISDDQIDKPLDRAEYLHKIRQLLGRPRHWSGRH